MKEKSKTQSEEAFDEYYQSIYQGRWATLKKHLLADEEQIYRFNKFASNQPDYVQGQEIPRSENGVLGYYVMDPASLVPPALLCVRQNEAVLDMCAAPGGKTLLLAEALNGTGELIANELSEARRDRLTKVLQNYIPRELRQNIFVKGKDGGKYALTHKEYFDKILVDAPCSGERHLLQNQEELKDWSSSRSKKLAQRQYALLTAALLALKKGGLLCYSTCSISELENDGVIEKFLDKKDGFQVIQSTDILTQKIFTSHFTAQIKDYISQAEKTKYGFIFLPDRFKGGPIYCCLISKLS